MADRIGQLCCWLGLHAKGPAHLSGRGCQCSRCGAWWGWLL